MSRGFVDTTAVRITVDEDWVEIKPKLGLGDRAQFSDAIYRMGVDKGANGLGMKVAIGETARVMLRLAVVNWCWPEAVTEEQIDRIDMDAPIWAEVLKQIGERNPSCP